MNNGNININGDVTTTGNNEAATYSTGGQAGINTTIIDTGAGASGKSWVVKNGLIIEEAWKITNVLITAIGWFFENIIYL